MDIEEDLTTNRNGVIIERTFTEMVQNNRVWSSPKAVKSPEEPEMSPFEILKQLLESDDLRNNEVKPKQRPLLDEIKTESKKNDSGVFSLTSCSDNQSVKTETTTEYSHLDLDQIYLVPKTKKWVKAKLVTTDQKGGLHLETLIRSAKIETDLKMIAYAEHPDSWLKVGSRVIVLVSSVACTGELSKGRRQHQLGVVAEYPQSENRNRYLTVLDDGRWVYTKPSAVKPLVYQSSTIWVDLPETISDVVRDFLTTGFDKKTEYIKGEKVTYFLNETVIDVAHIFKIDCSLVVYWSARLNRAFSVHKGLFPITQI